MSTVAGQYEPSEGADCRMGIGNHDGNPHKAETALVIDVVAHIDHPVWIDLMFGQVLSEPGSFVFHAMSHGDLQFRATGGYYRVPFGGENESREAGLVQTGYAQSVGSVTSNELHSVFSYPHRVVGEDAVEIEDDQVDRSDRRSRHHVGPPIPVVIRVE